MTDDRDVIGGFADLSVHEAADAPNNNKTECEMAEEAITTDSEEYLSEPLRYRRRFEYSTSTNISDETIRATSMCENDNFYSCNGNVESSGLQIPIVGYEIMEERARFTVFKLRVENKSSGDCWYVFRRYTDFVRLCNRLRHSHPKVVQHLPRKRWLGNNFDPLFLEERVGALQTLVNAMLAEGSLFASQAVQEFFCLSEPPVYSETNEESRAMLESLEETIYHLKQQVMDKERTIDSLHDALNEKTNENDNLRKLVRNSICQKCQDGSDDTEKITEQ